MNYQVAFNPTTKVAKVQTKGDAAGAGFSVIGEFAHGDPDPLGHTHNHVMYHHVRDALYKINVLDMQSVDIQLDSEYIALTGISSLPATVNLANGATQQIANTFTPANASNQGVTYSTTNAAIASVSASGLITAGATDGVATITVTSADGARTDTVVVTVA